MNQPFFSVVMPAFNAGSTIARAVRDILRQTFADWELIVVDDGSTDRTAEIATSFSDPRIRLVRLGKNCGLVEALNAGLEQAGGEWVARMDADDRCSPARLAAQHRQIQAQPRVLLHYSQAWLIGASGLPKGRLRPPAFDADLRWDLCFRNPIPHSSAVFPLGLVRDQLGGYAGDNVTADFDLWSRLLRRGQACGSRWALVFYRIHGGSIMGRENRMSERPSDAGLAQILESNLREWAGASDEDAAFLAGFALHPAREASRFCETSARLLRGLGAARPGPRAVAETDFTLLNRAATIGPRCAGALLHALRLGPDGRGRHLPKLRTVALRISGMLRGPAR